MRNRDDHEEYCAGEYLMGIDFKNVAENSLTVVVSAGAGLCGVGLRYAYELGRCEYFGVPPDFIQIDTIDAFVFGVATVVLLAVATAVLVLLVLQCPWPAFRAPIVVGPVSMVFVFPVESYKWLGLVFFLCATFGTVAQSSGSSLLPTLLPVLFLTVLIVQWSHLYIGYLAIAIGAVPLLWFIIVHRTPPQWNWTKKGETA